MDVQVLLINHAIIGIFRPAVRSASPPAFTDQSRPNLASFFHFGTQGPGVLNRAYMHRCAQNINIPGLIRINS